jgi:hypothetical protein
MLGDFLKELRAIHVKMKNGKNDEAFVLLCNMLGEEVEKPVKKKRGRPKKKPAVTSQPAKEEEEDVIVSATKKKGRESVSFKGNSFNDKIAKSIKTEEDGASHIDDSSVITSKRGKSPSRIMKCASCQKERKVYLKYLREGDIYKCERCAYKEIG